MSQGCAKLVCTPIQILLTTCVSTYNRSSHIRIALLPLSAHLLTRLFSGSWKSNVTNDLRCFFHDVLISSLSLFEVNLSSLFCVEAIFSSLFLSREPPCCSLVALSLFLAVLLLFLSPSSIMAVVVVVAVVDHLIMVGISCGGCKGRLTGLLLVDFALQASVTRNCSESRVTLHTTTTNHEAVDTRSGRKNSKPETRRVPLGYLR
jgi:hypothetical protein